MKIVAIEDCTILEVQGGYRQERRQAVLCACTNKQMFEIQRMVQSLVPESFMMIWESNEVHGNGFKMIPTETEYEQGRQK